MRERSIGYSRESGDVSMKIAVMAAGGVGGYFGARLAAAGEDVHFIARGAHLAALRANGLSLKSANGDLHLQSVHATDDPAQIGPVDIVIFAVKQYDTESAARLIKPLIGADTAAITLQNGMDRDERLRAVLGRDHVIDGAAYIGAAGAASPGVISHVGKVARIIFGEADGAPSARGERFLAACKNAGIDATLSTEIAKELWRKFAFLSAFSGVSSVIRKSIGAIGGDPDTRKLFGDALVEAVAVARAKGIDLGADYLAQQVNFADRVPPETKSSMQMDLEASRRLELDWLSGAVARIGDELSVPTPIHHFIYAALKLYAGGSR
jgi:2-dehydropantoate 2-reductase